MLDVSTCGIVDSNLSISGPFLCDLHAPERQNQDKPQLMETKKTRLSGALQNLSHSFVVRSIKRLFFDKAFLRFAAVGLANTAVGFSLIVFAMYVLQLNYALANVAGYAVGLVMSYFLNRYWTFRSRGKMRTEMPRFLAVFAGSYLVQFLLVIAMREHLRFDKLVAQAVGIAAFTLCSYLGHRLWTYAAA